MFHVSFWDENFHLNLTFPGRTARQKQCHSSKREVCLPISIMHTPLPHPRQYVAVGTRATEDLYVGVTRPGTLQFSTVKNDQIFHGFCKVGTVSSDKQSFNFTYNAYNPNYPFIRLFIGVISPNLKFGRSLASEYTIISGWAITSFPIMSPEKVIVTVVPIERHQEISDNSFKITIFTTHRIQVWYIYLHLLQKLPTCR